MYSLYYLNKLKKVLMRGIMSDDNVIDIDGAFTQNIIKEITALDRYIKMHCKVADIRLGPHLVSNIFDYLSICKHSMSEEGNYRGDIMIDTDMLTALCFLCSFYLSKISEKGE